MFTISDEQPENYQLSQGKKILNDSHIKNSATSNMLMGLEKGSLQSHETNSQVPRSNVVNGKSNKLQYGRILQQDKLKLYSANDAQGGIFNNFFHAFKNSDDIQESNKTDAPYQKMNVEGLNNIKPLHTSDETNAPSDKQKAISDLENDFNSVLATYVATYKTLNEDIVENRNRLEPVNKYFGKAVTVDNKTFHYVNNYGYSQEYSSDAWIKNDSSCPNNATTISQNELDILQNSVGMAAGQPCKLAGKIIQNKSTKEYAWVDIKGVKHVFSNTAWKGKDRSCNGNAIKLSDEKYNLVPSGENMATTKTVCDTLNVDPSVWTQLDELNEKLISISKQLQEKTGGLRTQDQEIQGRINNNKKRLAEYIQTLEKNKEKIKHHESIDMDSVQGGYEDSVLNLRQKSYRYLAWSYVAIAGGFIVVRQLMKAQ